MDYRELRNSDYNVSEMGLLEILTLMDQIVDATRRYDDDSQGRWEEQRDNLLWKKLQEEYEYRKGKWKGLCHDKS